MESTLVNEQVQGLINKMKNPDCLVRSNSLKGLEIPPLFALLQRSEIIDLLMGSLKDPCFRVRGNSAEVLGKTSLLDLPKLQEVIEALLCAIADMDYFVREKAVASLGKLITFNLPLTLKTIEALFKALGDPDPWVKGRAIKSLNSIIGSVIQELAQLDDLSSAKAKHLFSIFKGRGDFCSYLEKLEYLLKFKRPMDRPHHFILPDRRRLDRKITDQILYTPESVSVLKELIERICNSSPSDLPDSRARWSDLPVPDDQDWTIGRYRDG